MPFLRTLTTITILALIGSRVSALAADGTWTFALAGSDWNSASNWAGGIVANGADSTAYFTNSATSAQQVYLNNNRTVGNLNFGLGVNREVIGNGTLTLDTTSGRPTITTYGHTTLTSTIAGNDGLLKIGNFRLTLNGNNTYSGPTVIGEGILVAADGVGIPETSNLVFNGGLYQPSGSFDRPLGTGPGEVQWTGSGGFSTTGAPLAVRFNGNASPAVWGSGGFVPDGKNLFLSGSVEFQNDIDLGAGSRTIEIGVNKTPEISGSISNGDLIKISADANSLGAPLILTGTNTYGNTTIGGLTLHGPSGGTLQIGNGGTTGSLGTGIVTIGELGTLTFDRSNSMSVPNTIVSALSGSDLIQNGTGTTTLSGDLTGFRGLVRVHHGTLVLDYSAVDSSKITDNYGYGLSIYSATLELAGGTHQEIVGSTDVHSEASISRSSGAATLRLNLTTVDPEASLDISAGNLVDVDNRNVNGTLPGITVNGSLAKNATNNSDGKVVALLDSDYADAPRLGGQILGGLANIRVISGGSSGSVTIPATGTTTINTITQAASDGDVDIDVGTGKILRMGPRGTVLVPTGVGALRISGGSLTAGGADNTSGAIAVQNFSDVTISSNITNNGTSAVELTKLRSGRLVLTGTNSYTNGTTIQSGTLQIGVGGTTGSIIGNIHNNGVLVFNRSDNITFANVVSGGGTLEQAGAGTLILTGANTYSGGTIVNAGKLIVNSSTGSGVGGGAVWVNTGATLGGTGAVGGDVTINSGGHLAAGTPNNSIVLHSLTLTPGAILDFKLQTVSGRNRSDWIDVSTSNGLTIEGGIINLENAGAMAFGKYKLLEYSGTLNGSVSNFLLGAAPAGFSYLLVHNTGSKWIEILVTPQGDFNHDGSVDAADYVVWRKGLNSTYSQDDYSAWRANYGQRTSIGPGVSLTSVPEPTSWLLFLLIAVTAIARLRCRAAITAAG